MIKLPRNILRHRKQLLVRVKRGGMTYRAWVRGTDAEALRIAVAKRDEFLRIHGVFAKSNTGVEGISETEQWVQNRRIACFAVHWSDDRRRTKRIHFGAMRSRETALRMAVDLRRRMAPGCFVPRLEEVL